MSSEQENCDYRPCRNEIQKRGDEERTRGPGPVVGSEVGRRYERTDDPYTAEGRYSKGRGYRDKPPLVHLFLICEVAR